MSGSKTNLAVGIATLMLFCAMAAWIWVPSAPRQGSTVSTPARDISARLAANQEQMEALISVTTERPLFDATRQPQTAPAQAAPDVAPDPVLTLVGVLGVDEERVALVRVSTSAQLYRLAQGASLGPWRVIDIETNAIVVSKDGGPPDRLVIDR